MASTTPSPRQKLSESESTAAYIIGGGLTLLIIGFGLGAIQSTDSGTGLGLLMGAGIALMVSGVVVWLIVTRPWKQFDDWSKPLYVGHENDPHDEHDTHSETTSAPTH